ncbi:MAG: hypothetical protein JXM69_11395 [Anaerolineae bacterium]|nr:hypothetical protein [Anaerolineae bacterium]
MSLIPPHRYKVRKINLMPLAKFGCLLGGLAMVAPGLICAVASVQIVLVLRTFLEKWQTTVLELLGGIAPVELDFIKLLGLEAILAFLTRLDDQRFGLVLLIILIGVIGGGLLVGTTILLLGWGYNVLAILTGGLEVELQE